MIIEAVCRANSGETFFFEFAKQLLPMTRQCEIDTTKEQAVIVSEDDMWICFFVKTSGGLFGNSVESVIHVNLNTGRMDGNTYSVPNANEVRKGTKELWLYLARCMGYSFPSNYDADILSAVDMMLRKESAGKLRVHSDGRIVQSSGYFASYPMLVKALSKR